MSQGLWAGAVCSEISTGCQLHCFLYTSASKRPVNHSKSLFKGSHSLHIELIFDVFHSEMPMFPLLQKMPLGNSFDAPIPRSIMKTGCVMPFFAFDRLTENPTKKPHTYGISKQMIFACIFKYQFQRFDDPTTRFHCAELIHSYHVCSCQVHSRLGGSPLLSRVIPNS